MAFLTILIPTYNRARDLDYNLSLLSGYVSGLSLEDKVSVIVSDNASPDDTEDVVAKHIGQSALDIRYFRREKNMGAENNILFCLENAASGYVMLLGDDDYISAEYLSAVVDRFSSCPSLGCIISNHYTIFPDKTPTGASREIDAPEEYYKAGFDACLANAWRGHQVSGLCFRREGLLEAYRASGAHNLYPQVFFVAYSALHYDVLHLTGYPVRVTTVPQSKKDWNYGKDGLLLDFFDNFCRLGLTGRQRGQLERSVLSRQPHRYANYEGAQRRECFRRLFGSKKMSCPGKVWFAWWIIYKNSYTSVPAKILFFPLRVLIHIFKTIKR